MGWMRALFRRRRLEEVLDDEIRHHIELQTEEYIQSGLDREQAAIQASQRFGNVSSVQERCREQNRTAGIESIWQDLRFALRSFASQRAFTAVVLATLALGIGANTAVFSVLRAVLLEPLPLPKPERVVMVWENDRLRGTTKENASYPDYLDLKRSSAFEHLAASQQMNVTLTGHGEPERVPAARVTSNFFGVLGLKPAIGRVFGPGESGVVLSHALWVRKFEGSGDVLGASVYLDGFSGTILGVMPPEANSFAPRGAEIWTSLETVQATQFRGQHNTRILGRLRPAWTVDQAQAEVSAIMAQLEKEYPNENLGRGALVVPLHEELAGNMRPALKALSAAVIVLLLIACFNIANLLLARASARNREMAIRVSLGAARWRLTRQLLTESSVLASVGAALGMAVAWWGVRGLIALAPADTPLIDRTAIDATALATTLCVALLAWLVFGLLPAVRTASIPPAGALQSSGRNTACRASLRLRHALVIVQVAMATVLIIFSGLLIRSFWRLQQIDLGYEPRGALTLRVKLPETRYPWPKFPFRQWPAVQAFHDRLKNAVTQIPGIESASIAMVGPDRASWTTRVTVEGEPTPPEGEQQEAQFRAADPDYLRTTGGGLLRGRFFENADDGRHPMVAVVNEVFVRRHFPDKDPLNNRIVVFGIPRQVVGVIRDIRYGGPSSPPTPAMYFPVRQAPFPDLTLIVRSDTESGVLVPALRRAVLAADPNVAPFDVMTLERSLLESTARERFILMLLTAFAAVALALAAVGIYGVVAYAVDRRRQEIALRIALGARSRDVFSHIVGGMLLRGAAGVSIGLAIALFAARILQPLVFETSTRDTATYVVVASILLAVSLAGAALPAGRAASVNPATALRQD